MVYAWVYYINPIHRSISNTPIAWSQICVPIPYQTMVPGQCLLWGKGLIWTSKFIHFSWSINSNQSLTLPPSTWALFLRRNDSFQIYLKFQSSYLVGGRYMFVHSLSFPRDWWAKPQIPWVKIPRVFLNLNVREQIRSFVASRPWFLLLRFPRSTFFWLVV